jgi:hypothetical protein
MESALKPSVMPPYGFMWDDFQEVADKGEKSPRWNGDDASWTNWFQTTLTLLRDNVWPVYEIGTGWTGGSAASAVDMTRLELRLIAEFRTEFNSQPVWPSELTLRTHAQCFLDEDDGPLEGTLHRYCPDAGARDDLTVIVDDALGPRAWYVVFQLKKHFQRPRPHQMSMLMGAPKVKPHSYGFAKSAFTPALISGHAFQGAIAGTHLYAAFARQGIHRATALKTGTQQWAMDVGDRRVMGGVHYPLDNLASWVVALRILDWILAPGGKDFLAGAIRERSHLYRFLKKRIDEDPEVAALYKRPWDVLHSHL